MKAKQLTKEQLEEILKRNGRRSAKSQVAEDVYALAEHIAWLDLRLTVDALAQLQRTLSEIDSKRGSIEIALPEIHDEDLEHRCAIHHCLLEVVRPGKFQCPECENEWFAEEIKNKGTATR